MAKPNRAKLDSRNLRRMTECYSALGEPIEGLKREFGHYHCWLWRNDTMSPVIPLLPRLKKSSLKSLELHFKKAVVKGAFEDRSPYLNLINDGYHDVPGSLQLLEAEGWTKLESKSVLFWQKQSSLSVPKGIRIEAGRYFDQKLHRDFALSLKENFGIDELFMKDLDRMHRRIESRVALVVLYSVRGSKETPVGAGLVATHNCASYLYCGSISKSYRSKGLWHVLIAARQAVSSSGDGHVWLTTTHNLRIENKGDLNFEMMRFRKK
jgi:hypothetical protein